jgi:hypothetical protein
MRRKTQAQTTWTLPSYEANPNVSTFETVGTLYSGGDFQALRHTDPVVAPILNFIRKHLENLVWEVQESDSSYEAIAAAELTELFLRSIQFPRFAAQVWDLVHTFGYLYCERIFCEDPEQPLGFTAKLTPLFPPTVSRITTTPDGLRTSRVEQTVDVGIQTFEGHELIHYLANTDIPGNLTGISGLRPLVFPHRASQIDSKVYLDARTRSAGTIVLTLMDGVERGSEEYNALLDSLDSVVSGESGYLLLPHGVESQMLTNNNPPDGALENWKYYDAIKRAALGTYLENLGLNGAGSNRALGEVLADADNDRWQAQLKSLENLMNEQGVLPEFWDLVDVPLNVRPFVTIKREDEVMDIDDVLTRLNKLADLEDFLDPVESERLKREILEGRR